MFSEHYIPGDQVIFENLRKGIPMPEYKGRLQKIKFNGRRVTIQYCTDDEIIDDNTYLRGRFGDKWVKSMCIGDRVNEHLFTKIPRQYMKIVTNNFPVSLQKKSKPSRYDKYYRLLKENNLPENFKGWSLKNAINGTTISHAAAKLNRLPKDFTKWDLKDNNGWSVAHIAASRGHLPEGFNQWDIKNNDGNSVAHVAAMYGKLPKDFNQWDLKNNNGYTVAHTAASNGNLPKDFTQWDLKDNDGWCVAHIAAINGSLPKDFTQWNITDNSGTTVAVIAAERGHLPKGETVGSLLSKSL